MDTSGLPVAVVGSGAAGLAAAFRLRRAGHQVRLFERNDQVGGRMRTVVRDGFMIEEGPSVMARSYRSILGIAEQAGLGSEIVPASGVLGFPGRDGRVHYLDSARLVRDGLRTELVSARAKLGLLRLAADLVRYRKKASVEDLSLLCELDHLSAEEYGRARLGEELFDYLGDPCVRALVGCPSADVSAVDLLYVFGAFMTGERFVAFRGGMRSYAELVSREFDTRLGATVCSVEERPDEVELTWRDATGEHTESFAGAVLACPAGVTAEIHTGLDAQRREFLANEVAYSYITVCNVAVDVAPDIRSCYIFPPARDYPRLLAIALEHNKVPGRAPAGKGSVGLYPSSDWCRELYEQDDELVAKTLIEAAEPLVPGLADHAEFTHVTRAHPCVMQSRPGYWTAMRSFQSRSAGDRRVRLAGDYFCVSSLNTASASGERAARELLGAL
ncbi:hypothetical protein GCM10023321_60390 [Pseudonocardia eucalypti]|uniref:Amine oxidase domain-containing protein n=1 Tax=Pseudonocardia eucalypti TaxID=648755 RepID=A0ABP9QU78_9PSEU|nr:oxygen-dependent protoporphyrinogen oxidase [Pseudonocardia eucalypti]